jgi:hypothetical protein
MSGAASWNPDVPNPEGSFEQRLAWMRQRSRERLTCPVEGCTRRGPLANQGAFVLHVAACRRRHKEGKK